MRGIALALRHPWLTESLPCARTTGPHADRFVAPASGPPAAGDRPSVHTVRSLNAADRRRSSELFSSGLPARLEVRPAQCPRRPGRRVDLRGPVRAHVCRGPLRRSLAACRSGPMPPWSHPPSADPRHHPLAAGQARIIVPLPVRFGSKGRPGRPKTATRHPEPTPARPPADVRAGPPYLAGALVSPLCAVSRRGLLPVGGRCPDGDYARNRVRQLLDKAQDRPGVFSRWSGGVRTSGKCRRETCRNRKPKPAHR